jgi:hypothetical protein
MISYRISYCTCDIQIDSHYNSSTASVLISTLVGAKLGAQKKPYQVEMEANPGNGLVRHVPL